MVPKPKPALIVRADAHGELAEKLLTPAQRMVRNTAAFQAKRKAEGWRETKVWLSPETAERIERLKAEHGSQTDVIAEAIKRLAGE